jgi:hypothetical protein
LSQRRSHTLAAALAVSFIAALAALPARAEEPRRVGVVVALTVNATEERAHDLSALLAEALAEKLAVEVVAGGHAAALLGVEEVPDGCIADEACTRELGARLGAAELLALVVVEVGRRTQIEPTWIDTASGRTASLPAMAFEEGDDPTPLFRERAPGLLPHAPRRETSAESVADSEPLALERAPAAEPRQPRRISPVSWAAASLGVAALGGGVAYTAATRSLYRRCAAGGCEDGDRSRIRRRAAAADALWATAAVAGGVAAIAYLRRGDRQVGERARAKGVEVGPGPGELGVSLRGRF